MFLLFQSYGFLGYDCYDGCVFLSHAQVSAYTYNDITTFQDYN